MVTKLLFKDFKRTYLISVSFALLIHSFMNNPVPYTRKIFESHFSVCRCK